MSANFQVLKSSWASNRIFYSNNWEIDGPACLEKYLHEDGQKNNSKSRTNEKRGGRDNIHAETDIWSRYKLETERTSKPNCSLNLVHNQSLV